MSGLPETKNNGLRVEPRSSYLCGVNNCGGGKCIHVDTFEKCPHCGSNLIAVATSSVVFCSGDFNSCGYEKDD
jgi:hypothetical protein